MPISFANPQYLALLLLVPLVVVLGRRSLAGLDRTRRRLALTVRSLLIILVVLALAWSGFHAGVLLAMPNVNYVPSAIVYLTLLVPWATAERAELLVDKYGEPAAVHVLGHHTLSVHDYDSINFELFTQLMNS